MTDKSLGTFINPFTDSNLRKIYAEANFKLNELADKSYEDRHAYELSLKYYRDFINVLDNKFNEGVEQGKLLERIEMAKIMLQDGLTLERVMKITGLSEKDISK